MLRGGCFCGEVRYETEAIPRDEAICHCDDCRRAVGAVGVAWFTVSAASLRVTAGRPKAFQSSPGVERRFCGTCGTSLFYASEAHGDEIDVTTASLDDPNLTPPKEHIQTASRPAWVALCDGRPTFAGWRDET